MSSIRHQQIPEGDTFSVVVVDNASNQPITETVVEPLKCAGISVRLIQEPLPGIARARAAAVNASKAEWILFVDDDNELNPDYIAIGLRVIRDHPNVGCFGGKLLLPDSIKPPSWTQPFLPYLGIKDCGDERIERMSDHWGPWEPPTAGAFVHRDILQEWLRRADGDVEFFRLGRKNRNLLSCEDSLIMLGAAKVGRTNAYEPSLQLRHHLAPFRFRFIYLIRLMYGFGMSQVILEAILKGPQTIPWYYTSKVKFLQLVRLSLWKESNNSVKFLIGLIAYHLGARQEHLSQQTGKKV